MTSVLAPGVVKENALLIAAAAAMAEVQYLLVLFSFVDLLDVYHAS